MLLPEGHEKLRYCVIELVKERGSAKDIEKGLFKGLVEESGINFLWIKTPSTVVRGCNLEYYNVLSVEVYDGVIKALTFFKAEEDEQRKAEGLINEIFKCFEDMRLEEDHRLIDVDKYSDIPECFGKNTGRTANKPARTIHTSDVQTFHKQGNNTGTATSVNNNKHFVKNSPEACFFKRKGRKPTKKMLEELDKKLDLIMEGEYNPEFPEIKNDDNNEKEYTSGYAGHCDVFDGYEGCY